MQNEPPKDAPASKPAEPVEAKIEAKQVENNYSLSSGSASNSEDDSSSSSSGSSQMVEQGQGGQKKLVRYKYCCKICKHPDKSKKACVCVVPLSQRRADLGTGCRNCGCTGCSKEDYVSKGEDPEYHPEQNQQKTDKPRKIESKRQQKRPEKRRERSRSRKNKVSSPPPRRSRRESKSRSRSPEIIDTYSMKFHNFDRSLIGSMIIEEFRVNPTLLGFAIPQRSYSYIFGRPR